MDSTAWRKVAFTSRDIMKGRGRQLQYGFERLFSDSGSPTDAALFVSFGQMTNEFFFSPAAVRIAGTLIESYGGRDCPPPKRSEVLTLFMNGDVQSIEFTPEHDFAVRAVAS